jgi:hypothetical protein
MAKKSEHQLTMTGGKGAYYVAGGCSCGNFSKFLNHVTLRGEIGSSRKFIKQHFNMHKAEAEEGN